MPTDKRSMHQKNMRILFIARTYPPLVGGMERFARDFHQFVGELTDMKLMANPQGKRRILIFFFKVMGHLICNARKYDLVHFNDAILAPLLPVIRLFSRAKITFTVHGLDIVFLQGGTNQLADFPDVGMGLCDKRPGDAIGKLVHDHGLLVFGVVAHLADHQGGKNHTDKGQ